MYFAKLFSFNHVLLKSAIPASGLGHITPFCRPKKNEEPHKTSDKLERLHLANLLEIALGVRRSMWNDFGAWP